MNLLLSNYSCNPGIGIIGYRKGIEFDFTILVFLLLGYHTVGNTTLVERSFRLRALSFFDKVFIFILSAAVAVVEAEEERRFNFGRAAIRLKFGRKRPRLPLKIVEIETSLNLSKAGSKISISSIKGCN